MAKADENDSTEPTSPSSSTPDDRGDRADEVVEADQVDSGLTGDQVERDGADDADNQGTTDTPARRSGDPVEADADDELVSVGAARSSSRRGGSRQQAKKDEPTPKQRPGAETQRGRTSPPEFVRQSVAELRKVVYPTGQQLMSYFVAVLIFVLFIIAVVSLLDLAFGWLILRVFS